MTAKVVADGTRASDEQSQKGSRQNKVKVPHEEVISQAEDVAREDLSDRAIARLVKDRLEKVEAHSEKPTGSLFRASNKKNLERQQSTHPSGKASRPQRHSKQAKSRTTFRVFRLFHGKKVDYIQDVIQKY